MGLNHIPNLWVIHLSTLIEFVVIMTMFYSWKKTRNEKRLLLILGCAFVFFWFVSKFIFEPFTQMDTYTSTVAQMIYISIGVSMLFDVLKDSKTVLKKEARIWVASGMVIYSAGTLLTTSLFNMILKTIPAMLNTIWKINWILLIMVSLFYARGIWCQVKQ
jgi:hypothetical protein